MWWNGVYILMGNFGWLLNFVVDCGNLVVGKHDFVVGEKCLCLWLGEQVVVDCEIFEDGQYFFVVREKRFVVGLKCVCWVKNFVVDSWMFVVGKHFFVVEEKWFVVDY